MTQHDTKLKPCPLGGIDPQIYAKFEGGYIVATTKCQTSAYSTPKEARDAWNTRVGSAAQEAEQWQPIADVPTDTWVIGLYSKGRKQIVILPDDDDDFRDADGSQVYSPDYFIPLNVPAAPKEENGK